MPPPRRKSDSSAPPDHREEAANIVVGQSLRHLLRQAGISVDAEVAGRADHTLPDIFISAGGRHIVIEAKYGNPAAAAKDAKARFAEMSPPPHIVGALSYSPLFKKDPEKAAREGAAVEFAFTGHDPDDKKTLWSGPSKWRPNWRTGSIYDVAQLLRRPRAIVAPKDDEVERAVAAIDGALAAFMYYFDDKPGSATRIARELQVNLADSKGEKLKELKKEALLVAGLIVVGAMLFHSALAARDDRVPVLSYFVNHRAPHMVYKLMDCWGFILDEINYSAIFRVALKILGASEPSIDALMPLRQAVDSVRLSAQDGVDLTGQVYHRILTDAKTLAAFYTSIPAAMMMSGVALNMDAWGGAEKWADMNFIRKFRVADPACGSGMLLTSACWQIRDNCARADFRERGYRADGENGGAAKLHKILMEEVAWGYDILETASHLTAANLGMMAPEVSFEKTHISRVILGKTDGNGVAAGSLEMLDSEIPIFNRGGAQVETQEEADSLPELDLCIMNPPFVRGTKGNESFNFLPPEERDAVRARMRKLGKKYDFVCDKGQGPGFVALACKRVKPGGRVAMILPATLAVGMGKAWGGSRARLERDFNLETMIVSRDPKRPYFSMSANFQECVCIARKRRNGEKPADKALFVSLRRNPTSGGDGLAAARAILKAEKEGGDLGDLDDGFGQFARLSWHGKSAWRGVSFANLHLAFVAERLTASGSLSSLVAKGQAPLRPLSELADIGSHRLDLYVNDPDEKRRRARLSPTETEYAGYWPGLHKRNTGIWPKDVADIWEDPHCWLLPLEDADRGTRNANWAEGFFAKSGAIVINQTFWFKSARRLASLISRPVQASCYWPVRLRKESETRRKAMTVWLNSSPSVLLIAHACSSTQGAKVKFSQAAARELPVVDLDKLTPAQLGKLADAFDEIVRRTERGEGLLEMSRMTKDPTRKMLDDAVSDALGLGDFRPLRAALAAEPIIVSRPVADN